MAVLTLRDLAATVDGTLIGGDPSTSITGLASLKEASATELSFCSESHYLPQLAASRAAAVIVPRKLKIPAELGVKAALVVVENADLAMSSALEAFAPPIARPAAGVDGMARVSPSSMVGAGARIGPFVMVGDRAVIGKNVVLHAGVVVGDDVKIGDDCELFANVVIRERCVLKDRVVIHAGSVIGSDGFGYRWDGRRHAKVPQIGTVVIESDVEIGSCTCVDRAKFAETVVGPGTKIDNLVQVGHNVKIGAHCIVVGQVGLAGSVVLGNGVVLGGQSAIRDHITLGDGSMVAACSGVAEDVAAKAVVSGLPALPHRQSLREQAALRRLPELVQQMRKLADEISKMKEAAEKMGVKLD